MNKMFLLKKKRRNDSFYLKGIIKVSENPLKLTRIECVNVLENSKIRESVIIPTQKYN